ncbi:TPA: Bro-N domain-containing protein [Citrobacter freundii]|nr:Bro-N domain-containing protein [Citrobacter freundii]HBU9823233.1 Bro-N domain-containing protein [Citrobacter freundii]HBU9836678.1 Bro-N domain-containing protein [Citrobacter freundii]HBV1371336.1 Bro-N domain-containing protein [Citrobacter freundii]HBV2725875.1 Bro-N domain-containing protein [Citrobacter freundii]
MNIVAKSDLNFHGMNLIPVDSVPGIWLTSTDVAKALGYKSSKSITNLFNQNADEFSDGMTQVIESVTSGNYRKKVRVFSLRGAHLIAMFARTDVAKEFRRWVLDILDREVAINMPVIDEPSIREKHAYNANALAKHYAVMYEAWKNQIYPALRAIESPLATRLCDRFKDGAIFMMYVQKGAEKQLEKGEIARI